MTIKNNEQITNYQIGDFHPLVRYRETIDERMKKNIVQVVLLRHEYNRN